MLKEGSETSTKLRGVITRSVMQKLLDLGSTNASKKYKAMLNACAADGIINALEKRLLHDYAKSHGITEQNHIDALTSIGWTKEEFDVGVKNGVETFSESTWDKVTKKLSHLTDFNYMKNKYISKQKQPEETKKE